MGSVAKSCGLHKLSGLGSVRKSHGCVYICPSMMCELDAQPIPPDEGVMLVLPKQVKSDIVIANEA